MMAERSSQSIYDLMAPPPHNNSNQGECRPRDMQRFPSRKMDLRAAAACASSDDEISRFIG